MKITDLFERRCVNAHPSTDKMRNEPMLYQRHDFSLWAMVAFEKGEPYFYCRPVDPEKPNGKYELCKPEYRWFLRNHDGLSEEEYASLIPTEKPISCIRCGKRMECESYLTWLQDPKLIRPPVVRSCERYREEEWSIDNSLNGSKSYSSGEKNPKWIPCSEKLPEYDVAVLTYDGYCFFVEKRIPIIRDDNGEAISGDWWVSDDYDENESDYYPNLRDGACIAWMPLPEPYQEERRKE